MLRPSPLAGAALASIALATAVYHLGYALWRPWNDSEHAILHVGLAILIIGLVQARARAGASRWLGALAGIAGCLGAAYLFTVADDLEMRFGIGLTDPQLIAGWITIVAVILLSWLEWGLIITTIGIAALGYFFFGELLPGVLRAAPHASFDYAMTFLISGGGSGLFGQITPISANVIFLFMLFGALLSSTGVTRMFLELGNLLGRRNRGGAAVTCVVSSSLFGTVTGATVANVAITGTFTIPTMKRQGFRPEDAGAIEAVASCGGQILPPVMGVGAFVMAAYLGISYISVAAMALIPALLFYASVLLGVVVLARKAPDLEVGLAADTGIIRSMLPGFLLPLGALVYFLVQGFSPGTAVLIAIGVLVVVTFLRPSSWRSMTGLRAAARSIGEGLVEGAKMGAGIAIIAALISLVAQSLITTALGPKFASAVGALVGDQLLVGLFLLMLAALILGCGLPTVAAYTMVAIMLIPAMKQLGVDPAAAHFFAYYFAVYAAVTPPVATAAIIAGRIAGASFWKTAWASSRLMVGPLFLPYLFVYHQELLQFPPDLIALVPPLAAWLIGTLALLAITFRFLIGPMRPLDYLLAGAAVLGAFRWMAVDEWPILALAAIAMSVLILRQWWCLRNEPIRPVVSVN